MKTWVVIEHLDTRPASVGVLGVFDEYLDAVGTLHRYPTKDLEVLEADHFAAGKVVAS